MYDEQKYEDFIQEVKQKDLFRQAKVYEYSQGVEYSFENKTLINFSSNSYLGMHLDKRVVEASSHATQSLGVSSIASRLVCGTMPLHDDLEKAVAQWKGADESIVFNSGFQANVGLIQALADKNTMIFADKLVHASIIDGIRLSGAKFQRFHHNDISSLGKLLERYQDVEHKIIISETVFSMDGDEAPIADLVSLSKKYEAFLYLDDAHGAGVYGEDGCGPTGRWAKDVDLLLGTFSKAFGSFGAYACISKALKDYFLNTCRSYIFSTALPPGVIAANLKSLELMASEEYEAKRRSLLEKCKYLRESLKQKSYQLIEGEGPIIAVLIGSEEGALNKSKELFEKGFLIPAIRPPTVPKGSSRLRLTLSSLHTYRQIEDLLAHF
ncbi:8-amino-7-oxononanoate synthase [Lentisphaera araneosa HTCC2155]|uniref:8-amino-7-oxononanoate synthase n=2 Tax=Lentisphaera TaxID=256846 RepID=A6DTG2_9BACT|nr:8-amino-7-oxononanoate synthase [Lentisphaera araneosa HTCC2155]